MTVSARSFVDAIAASPFATADALRRAARSKEATSETSASPNEIRDRAPRPNGNAHGGSRRKSARDVHDV